MLVVAPISLDNVDGVTKKLSRADKIKNIFDNLWDLFVPSNVSINEAIELTKKFDDPKAKAFVNGVLNSVKNELEGLSNFDGTSTLYFHAGDKGI